MQKVTYSKLKREAEEYWDWSEQTPIPPIPAAVAREGAGSEARTPLMHYGTVMPVYLGIARYLGTLKLKKGMRLIELGSGSGRALTYIKMLFPELEVWGVDYSREGVEYAKASYGKYGVKFKHVPAQKTTLKAGHFDFVISSHVIEHVTKEEGLRFIQETSRLLKTGGYAFIGTPERRHCQNLYMKNPTEDKKHRLVPPHEHEYTQTELRVLAEEVFAKKNVRVDGLVNPTFYKIFKSSIDSFKPTGGVGSKVAHHAYRAARDVAPRPIFDRITRIGVKRKMAQYGTTFHEILDDNALIASGKGVPDNLLLVCQK